MMEIICPDCGYTKAVPPESIPAGVRWATCPRCKGRFDIRPPEEKRPAPWEDPAVADMTRGLLQTLRMALFSPRIFFNKRTMEGGTRGPLTFGLLVGSGGMMFQAFWQFLVMEGGVTSISDGLLGQIPFLPFFFLILILIPPLIGILMFVTGGILHLFLSLLKGGKGGFEATFRVMAYSQAGQIWGMIPFIGGLIAGLWVFAIQWVGLREAHKTSYFRVFLSFILFFLALLPVLALMISLPGLL